MRDYQVRGLNWLISLYENGINGILADEMVSLFTLFTTFNHFSRVQLFIFAFLLLIVLLSSPGFGKDSPDHCPAGIHEALQKHPRSAHGSGPQVHPLQLDERVQAMGAFSPGSVSDWKQRRASKLRQNCSNSKLIHCLSSYFLHFWVSLQT